MGHGGVGWGGQPRASRGAAGVQRTVWVTTAVMAFSPAVTAAFFKFLNIVDGVAQAGQGRSAGWRPPLKAAPGLAERPPTSAPCPPACAINSSPALL